MKVRLPVTCDRRTHGFETDRLHLRSATEDDIPALTATIDPAMHAIQGWTHWSAAEAAAAFVDRGPPRRGHGSLAIVERGTDQVIGLRNWHGAGNRSDTCLTGNWLAERARGRGYATEELVAFVDFAHQHLGYRYVVAGTDADNLPSLRLHRRAGFTESHTDTLVVELPDGRVPDPVVFVHEARSRNRCHCPVD